MKLASKSFVEAFIIHVLAIFEISTVEGIIISEEHLSSCKYSKQVIFPRTFQLKL